MGAYGFGTQITKDGKLDVGFGNKIIGKETKGNKEFYTIENDNTLFGGDASQKWKRVIAIVRDKNGNVIGLQNGNDSLSEKEIKAQKEFLLKSQIQSAVYSADMSFGSTTNHLGSSWVANEKGEMELVPFKKLTEKQRKSLGMSEEVYKDLTNNAKKDKKQIKKIAKGLRAIQNNGKGVFYLGDITNFKVENGKCKPHNKKIGCLLRLVKKFTNKRLFQKMIV